MKQKKQSELDIIGFFFHTSTQVKADVHKLIEIACEYMEP